MKKKATTSKIKPWRALPRRLVFTGHNRQVEKVVFRLPDGRSSDFYIKVEKSPVCVVALTKDKKVILVEQYRPGPGRVLLELPGGGLDKGESPRQAAARELREETGYKGRLRFVGRAYDSPYASSFHYCFVATDCRKVGEQELDEGEFAAVRLVPLRRFRTLMRKGNMTNMGLAYQGLDYLGLLT